MALKLDDFDMIRTKTFDMTVERLGQNVEEFRRAFPDQAPRAVSAYCDGVLAGIVAALARHDPDHARESLARAMLDCGLNPRPLRTGQPARPALWRRALARSGENYVYLLLLFWSVFFFMVTG